jgi:hypothetical protein
MEKSGWQHVFVSSKFSMPSGHRPHSSDGPNPWFPVNKTSRTGAGAAGGLADAGGWSAEEERGSILGRMAIRILSASAWIE